MIVLATLKDRAHRLAPKGPRLKRILAGAGFLGASTLLSISIFATAPAAQPETKTEKAWPVSVIAVQPQALAPVFTSFGKVQSTRVTRIQTDIIASIETVHVHEGQRVDKGDVLVELDRDELNLTVLERQAELAEKQAALMSIRTEREFLEATTAHHRSMFELAEKKLKRHQDLFEKRMISRSLLDEIVQQSNATTIDYQRHRRALASIPSRLLEQEARIAHAEAALSQARLDLDHAVIVAPFSGPVLSVHASPGNHSILGAALVEIADIDGFEVRAPVSNEYSTRVRKHLADGREITATFSDGDTKLTLVLQRLAGNVHSGQSGLNAFFKLPQNSRHPLPELGRVVDLAVTLPAEGNVIALPVQSIYESDRIYEVSDGNRLQSITVDRVGDYRTQSGEYRVLVRAASLTAGKRIITTQLPKAISGLLVAPVS